MDAFTSGLQMSAQQYIPHMSGKQCMTSITFQNTRYSITIAKIPDTPRFIPATPQNQVISPLLTPLSPKILGKRPHISLISDLENNKNPRLMDTNPLYNNYGHNFD